jgi:hypothetical protein
MNKDFFIKYLAFPILMLAGYGFAYRLLHIPSRAETAIFCIAFFLIPTLKFPKLGVYYLFCLPLFIPLFRRMYYLVSERPDLDYLMLISDGVMGGLIVALILLWILNKEKPKDLFSALIIMYIFLLFIKIFVGAQAGIQNGFYGFKFNGLYVFFYFGGSYVLTRFKETKSIYLWASVLLFITALYGTKQILFGYSAFEQKWLDSITFTTLRIDGVVRPFSTYVSPAAMSDGMTILFVLGLYWMVVRGRHMALLGFIFTASSVAPILIATVRTNWLAVIAGIFFYGIFLRLQNKWLKIAIVVVMMAGIGGYSVKGGGDGGGGAQTAMLAKGKSKNLAELMITNRTAALANPLQEYSVQKRMTTWVGIMYTSLQFPLGKGQGTTGYAHSYYFLILGEIGFPGLIVFLAIVIMAFYRGMTVIAKARDPQVRELARALVTLIFMISVLNLTGTHLHTPPGDIFFWFSLGCISRFYREIREAEAAELAAANAQTEGTAEAPSAPGSPALPRPGNAPIGGGSLSLPGGARA